MIFADIDLARRIEAAECRLSTDIAHLLAQKGKDAFAMPAAGGAVVYCGPDSPFNKLIGAGFGEGLDEPALAAAERACADRSSAIRAEVSSLADPAIAAALSARGYVLVGFEDVLGRRLDGGLPAPVPGVTVADVAHDALDSWIHVVVTGFMSPDTQGVPSSESPPREALEPLFLDMADAPGYRHFVARMDGVDVGGGSMRVDQGLAQLCGAATLPEYRRRGVQTTLLADRLRWAAEHGCDLAVVTTLPGSKSQENVVRRGFERLYTRAILVKSA